MRKEWPFENGPKKGQNPTRTKSEEGLVSSLV